MQLNVMIIFRTTYSENKEEGLRTLHGKVGKASQKRPHRNWGLKISEGSILVQSGRHECVQVWDGVRNGRASPKVGVEVGSRWKK